MKKIIKVVMPIAVVATTATFFLLKGKKSGIPVNLISNVTNNVVSGLAKNPEGAFGGLTQSKLDGLAKETYRGVKAVVEGDTLKYMYKSNSGKSINSALFKFDDAGKLVGYLGNGPAFAAGSPRTFFEKILEKMQGI